ncbi:MAG: TonB-dependent receptor [Acidobacteria bacterium]|nr:TonB-dependent receptor [Acidobacteriota bacterium]
MQSTSPIRTILYSWFRATLVLLVSMAWFHASAVAAEIHGKVEGPSGVLPGARLTLLLQGRELQTVVSDERGEFSFENLETGNYQLQVVSAPFVPIIRDVSISDADRSEAMIIAMGALNESVTVTAGRIPVAVTASTSEVRIMSGEDLKRMPYQSLDDSLRSFPEFSLFRRSSSLVAHPTTQGVSLRGIGPSGVSRSLVLLNGIPLNDAFGGWVYWDRVPLLQIQQTEIVNGGQSSIYGNYSLGGVVQVLKKEPQPATLEFQAQGGSKKARDFEFAGSHRVGPWGFGAAGSFFDFDGYPIVTASQRGRVDVPAFSQHQALRFTVDRAPVDGSLVWSLDGGLLSEDRGNGTPLTPNRTRSFDVSTGVQWSLGPGDQLEARSFFRRTVFAGNFSAVAADRNTERLTVQQHVPSADGGASLQWYGTRGRNRIAAGADIWVVSGISTENVFAATGRVTTIRHGGGKQSTAGLFAEENFAISPRASVAVGARLDFWKNFDGMQGSFAPGTTRLTAAVSDTNKVVFSPSAGFAFDATSRLSLHGSVYRSFRAPTLNELYRSFTVGNVVTSANTALTPERSLGAEFGGRLRITDRLRADVSAFVNRLEQPVSNVTQQITATQILRQRRNLGNARIYGIQSSLAWQLSSKMRLQASYLWDRASVTDFAADRRLVGKRLPGVPEHRATFVSDVSLPWNLRANVIGRFVDRQYDDDLNALVLNRYFQLDAEISRWLGESARLFVALENLTDTKIIVSRTPVDFIGTPFVARAGISFRLHRGNSF